MMGEKIAALRRAKGMTQEELAATVGISAQSVSKWENSVTMPDIMLLPVLADIFEVTIDELYGKAAPVKKQERISFDDVPQAAYDALLKAIGLPDLQQDEDIELRTQRWKKQLLSHPKQQSMIFSRREGGVYADSRMGIVSLLNNHDSMALLESKDAKKMLSLLSEDHVCAILRHQLKNAGVSYTAASVAVKCGMSEKQAKDVLDRLVEYNFNQKQSLDVGDEIISVYTLYGTHRMMLVYVILSLAERLANWNESYYGFRS